MHESTRFIAKPHFGNLSFSGLHYKDILTYVTLRSFYNTEDRFCYPGQLALASRSGMCKTFISSSLKRLQTAGLITIWKVGKTQVSHRYFLNECNEWDKVSFDIFKADDLTSNEKAILLIIREYASENLTIHSSIAELARATGLTYRTIDKQYRSLLMKGYLLEVENIMEETKCIHKHIYFTDKLNWEFTRSVKTKVVNDEQGIESTISLVFRLLGIKGTSKPVKIHN